MLSVIVPCYNEEAILKQTNAELHSVLNANNTDFEIIYINDGSEDQTTHFLKNIASASENVRVINFSRNFGHQPAVSAGLEYCKGDYAVIIDADLQDPPKCIPEMLQTAIDQDADVVYGVRKVREGETFFKKLTAKLFYRILNYFSEYKIPVDTGDFRLVKRNVINEFNKLQERQKYIRGLVSWLGFKQVPYFYNRDKRIAGETHYPFWKMVSFATRGLLYFSKKPLQIATNLGAFCVLGSLAFLIFSLIHKYLSPELYVTGWTSTIGLVVFFGGVQLITIGLLGSYIGNMFDEVKGRPEYIVKEIIE